MKVERCGTSILVIEHNGERSAYVIPNIHCVECDGVSHPHPYPPTVKIDDVNIGGYFATNDDARNTANDILRIVDDYWRETTRRSGG